MLKTWIAALALLAGAPAAAQPVTWTMPTEYPASAMPGEGVRFFAERVRRATQGQLQITPSYDAAAGIKSADMVKAVQQRRVPAGDALAGSLAADNPLFLLSSLPFIATTVRQARLLAEAARPAYEKALAAHDQVLLYVTPWPASGIWAKRPIVAPADLKGLAIRTYDATGTAVMKAAGAAAVELSFADAMPRLRDGSITAVLSSGDGGAGRRLWDFLPHFTEINYAMPLSVATVHRDALGALPANWQRAVREAAAETERHQWQLIESRLEENYARMRANGVTITTAIQPELAAEFQRAARGAIDAWAERAGPDGKRLLEEFQRANKS